MNKLVKIFIFNYINKELYGLKSTIQVLSVKKDEEEINKAVENILNENKNNSKFGGINIVENNIILEIIDSSGKHRKLTKQESIEHRRATFPPEAKWKLFTIDDCQNCTNNKNKKCRNYFYNFKTYSFNPLSCRVLLEYKGAKINK